MARPAFIHRAAGVPVIYGEMPARKRCTTCGKTKPQSAFPIVRKKAWSRRNGERWYVGLYYECKQCKNTRCRRSYKRVGRRDRVLSAAQAAARAEDERNATPKISLEEHATWEKNERALRERLAARCRRPSLSEVYASTGAP